LLQVPTACQSLKHNLRKQKNRDATACSRTGATRPNNVATRADLDAKHVRKALADENHARGTMKNVLLVVRDVPAVARNVPREAKLPSRTSRRKSLS
jgi:hypothetical protein